MHIPRRSVGRRERRPLRTIPRRVAGRARALTVIAALCWTAQAGKVASFEFTTPEGVVGWTPMHDVSALEASRDGLKIHVAGADPYIAGPARDYPSETPLWLEARLRSEAGGTAQIFYFRDAPTEEGSVRFTVPPGQWVDIRLPLPALGPGVRFRFDPPGASGECVVARLRLAERAVIRSPVWPQPSAPEWGGAPLRLDAGGTAVSGVRLVRGGLLGAGQRSGRPTAGPHQRRARRAQDPS